MHWLEVSSFTEKSLSKIQNQKQDDIGDKLAREAWVVGAGLANGIADGAEQSWKDPEGTAGKVGLSLGIGLVLGVAQRTAGIGRIAAEAVATGFGFAFAFDALTPKRWEAVQNALIDTWNSPDHNNRNALVISDNLGRFVFDLGLATTGTFGGAKVGQSLMRRFDVPKISASYPGYPSGEHSAWETPPTRRFNTMPMSAAEVEAVTAASAIEPIPLRSNGSQPQRVFAYEGATGQSQATGPRVKKSPVTSMPAVTGMREGGNGTVILELADGTTVTTTRSSS